MVEAMPQQEEATSLPPQADAQKQKQQTQQTQRDMEEEKRLSSGTESGTESEDSEDDDDDVVGPARPPCLATAVTRRTASRSGVTSMLTK